MAKANSEAMKRLTDKARYDKNYLRLYGRFCPVCKGRSGTIWDSSLPCLRCKGLGYVEKKK